jgi:hypothetical protein
VNKDQQEDMIEDALEEFAFAFPRLQMLKKTYISPQSETLWKLVGAVYAEVIVFAREAAIYYQKSSFSKLGDDCMCTSALTPYNRENHRNSAAPPKNESIEECSSHSKASCRD